MSETTIGLKDLDEERLLLGHLDRNLRILRSSFDVQAVSRGGKLTIRGAPEDVGRAVRCVEEALDLIRTDVSAASEIEDLFREDDAPRSAATGKAVRCKADPRTPNQQTYMEAIQDRPVTIGVGPAGTGKTFIAVAMAVSLLESGDYRRIILVRPVVEAGERLGFLPGDVEAKVNPYVRPLYDALEELLPRGALKRYIDEGIVEISPLAYMRGRTLNNAVIILDEAQNTTIAQMKMFLTRMGKQSKIIVTGDLTQVDLPPEVPSGLPNVLRVLQDVPGIAIHHMHRSDIVRHAVVEKIVKAYSSWEGRRMQEAAEDRKSGNGGNRAGDGHRPERKGQRRS